MEMSGPTLLELDGRRRLTLGRLASHDRYLATKLEDGRILLDPAVVMTEAEFALAHDDAFWGRVAESAKLPSEPLPDDLL
jgi:hypothetical protein